MGIAKHKPSIDVPLDVKPTVAVSEQYESVIVDSKQTPLPSLRAYLEGMPWTLDAYYVQVIGKDTGLSTVDVTVPNTYQSYEKIVSLEVRVQSALENSFDETNGLTTVTGNAIIPAIIVPSKGDVFVASAGFNRKAAFGVISVTRLQFNTESAYQIEYELLFDISIDTERYRDLEEKTQRTYYYHKERYIQGLDSKVIEEDHKYLLNIQNAYTQLVEYYFKHFYNSQHATLIQPGQDDVIYDHRLVEFILMMVDSTDAFNVKNTRLLNIDSDQYIKQECIYDAFMQRNPSILKDVHRMMGLASVKSFSYSSLTHSIRYSGVQYIVYPYYPDNTIESHPRDFPKPRYINVSLETLPGPTHLSQLSQHYYVESYLSIPYIPNIESLETYLFTDSFYENRTVNTLLEIVLLDFINGRRVKLKELDALLTNYRHWSRLAQFYYLPFLIAMVRFITRK